MLRTIWMTPRASAVLQLRMFGDIELCFSTCTSVSAEPCRLEIVVAKRPRNLIGLFESKRYAFMIGLERDGFSSSLLYASMSIMLIELPVSIINSLLWPIILSSTRGLPSQSLCTPKQCSLKRYSLKLSLPEPSDWS